MVYSETAQEVLIARIRELINAEDLDKKQLRDAIEKGIDVGNVFDVNYRAALQSIIPWAVKKGSSWSSIFASSATPRMLVHLYRLGPHFLHTDFMKIGWLNKNMSNIHGGVRALHFLL